MSKVWRICLSQRLRQSTQTNRIAILQISRFSYQTNPNPSFLSVARCTIFTLVNFVLDSTRNIRYIYTLMITEPMKAPRQPLLDFATLQYPCLASFKEDGIRGLTHPNFGPVSRTFKPIRNIHVRAMMKAFAPPYLDGEIVVDDANFNDTQSAIMSYSGEPDFQYRVFDSFLRPDYPFVSRMADVRKLLRGVDHSIVTFIEQISIDSPAELQELWEKAADLGKEGLIVRSMGGRYKSGRVTEREGIMYKIVTLIREDARIVGFEPMYRNCNIAKLDAFGRTIRSKHDAGMTAMPLLGAWVVSNQWGTFNVSGFTLAQRKDFWERREAIVANRTLLTYKYKPYGTKDAPRCPIFVGLRSEDDL